MSFVHLGRQLESVYPYSNPFEKIPANRGNIALTLGGNGQLAVDASYRSACYVRWSTAP